MNTAQVHLIPKLPLPPTTAPLRADLPAIRDAIAATRHLLEMFRLQLEVTRHVADSDYLLSACSTSTTNSITSPLLKNERTLASQ